jgi:hypothetical protein
VANASLRCIRIERSGVSHRFRDPGLTIDDLKSGDAAACTLPERRVRPLPLPDTGRDKTALPDTPLKFVAEVERDTVAWLFKFRFIPADQCDDFLAILTALNRVGLRPTISRVA